MLFRSGLPTWTIPVIGVCVVIALCYGVKMGRNWLHDKLAPVTKPEITSAKSNQNKPAATGGFTPSVDSVSPAPMVGSLIEPEVLCTGWMLVNGSPMVMLSDGTTITGKTVTEMGNYHVMVAGVKYRMAKGHAFSEYIPPPSNPADHVGQVSSWSPPVNQAEVLPAIHAISPGPAGRAVSYNSQRSTQNQYAQRQNYNPVSQSQNMGSSGNYVSP